MGPEATVRFFRVVRNRGGGAATLFSLACLAALLFFSLQSIFAAGAQIDPNGAGNTTQGTVTTCSAGGNYECINDGISSSSAPSTAGDFITFAQNQFDSYQMSSIGSVATATAVEVFLYHVEDNTNMQFEAELWDASESAQIGTSQNLTNAASAAWHSVVFSGLSLDQSELDDIRIRTSCLKTGVGPASVCTNYAMYAHVTYTPTTTPVVSLEEGHYHWRNDDGNEAGATSATGGFEDTPLLSLPKESPIRLRVSVSNEGNTTSNATEYRLEYAQKVSSCAAASGWIDVGTAGGIFDMYDSSNLTDGAHTTDIATSTGGVTNENLTFLTPNGGQKDTSSQTNAILLSSSEFVELEYSIQATTTAPSGTPYCFRLTDAGSPLDAYIRYAEARIRTDTDFIVQRGVSTMVGDTLTLTANSDYRAPSSSSSAFIRITNTHMTGAGDSGATTDQNADDVTAYITNPSNILTSVTFARGTGATGDTRIAWEIVEYDGVPGGENEFVVRQQQAVTYGATNATVTSPQVSGVGTDADVAVFITGQFNPDSGLLDYNTGLSTASWDAQNDTAVFTRGESGNDTVSVSYAVVEFSGSNWNIQRSEHTYTSTSTETESIGAVGSLSRAFVHAQKRVGTGNETHEDFGHQVWLSGIGQVSFRLDSGANTPSGHVSVAWVIENTQVQGDVMEVTRSNGTQTGGTAPFIGNINIGKTLDDLSVSSVFMNNSSDGTGSSWPEPMISTRLISTTQYEIWVSNTSDTRAYRTEIVEWPTARRKFTQNYYRLYADNDALDPTDPWPLGVTDLGENTEMTALDDPISSGESIRLRMTILVSGAAVPASVDAFELQYGERTTTCTAIPSDGWTALGEIGSTTAIWRGHSGTPVDGTSLSGEPPMGGDLNISVSDVAGTYEEENESNFTPHLALVGEDIEFDWAIENNDASEKTDYCFRMVEADGTLLSGYNFYPVIRTVGYGPQSQDWRWYDDAENETPTTTLAATNTAPIDIAYDNTIQLRITLKEMSGGTEENAKFKLQFSEYSNFSTSTDVAEIGNCSDFSLWCYANGGSTDNATITTRTLGDADPCASGAGAGCGTHNESGTSTSNAVHSAGEAAEFAFTLKHSGARVNRVYFFRLYDVVNDVVVPLGSSETYPSLLTEGAGLNFTMQGISSSTVTEGVTIDVDTTPSEINFGNLSVGGEVEAAHRLQIDTNGTEGYQVLMYSTSDLLSPLGVKIESVNGTNQSPISWETGCSFNSGGCFGYHSGDDTLEGGSARFSALDTYARLSTTTPEEIVYSSSPVAGETVDIIYKLEISGLQEAGQYETNIVYIAIPIF